MTTYPVIDINHQDIIYHDEETKTNTTVQQKNECLNGLQKKG